MSREGQRLVLHLCVALLVVTAVAGVRPAAAQPQGAPAPAKPPVMTFGPDGVALADAVSIALKNDPALRLAENDVQRLEGAVQERRGQFDFTLKINANFEHRVQELSETRKADERKKRKSLSDDITSFGNESTLLGQEISLLQQLSTTNPGDPLVKQLFTFSPTLASQIQLLDAMILDPATPATARADFLRIRTETIQQSLSTARAQKTQIDTARVESQTKLTNMGEPPDDEFFRNGTLSMSLAKVFRSGASLSPFVDGSIDTTTYVDKPISADFGGKGVQDQMKFRFGTSFSLPILRGRGADAFAAGEKAAVVQLDAGRLQVQHQAMASALGVVRAYWALRGAADVLETTKRSQDLQVRVVDITKALIQAGEMPAVELARAQAGEARAKASVKDAERRVHEARVALALAMGLSATADDASLPTTKDAFPGIGSIVPPSAALIDGLSSGAVESRRDLSAARKYEEAAGVIAHGADLNTRPRLDLTGETYWTALGQRAFKRVADRWVGPSVSVGLDFEKPFGNNGLEGAYAQREAERRQQQISVADLERQIRLGVVRAASTLQESVSRAEEAQAAVEFYQKTVESELERFRVGESTLINTLTTERQLTDARLALVSAMQQLATLIAELRYETGTLLDGTTVAAATLVSVPQVGGR